MTRPQTPFGFTLIEVLIYIGLFAIIIGGGVISAYTVMENTGRNQGKAMLQSEGDFVIGKVSWALSGAQAVNLPVVGTPGSLLSLNKQVGTNTVPVIVALSGTDIVMGDALASAAVLNNSNTQVSNLVFMHTLASGDGIDPENISVNFRLSTRTNNGQTVFQDFSSVTYLRK